MKNYAPQIFQRLLKFFPIKLNINTICKKKYMIFPQFPSFPQHFRTEINSFPCLRFFRRIPSVSLFSAEYTVTYRNKLISMLKFFPHSFPSVSLIFGEIPYRNKLISMHLFSPQNSGSSGQLWEN